MEYRIKTARSFEKELKRLGKRYASITDDYACLLDELHTNPQLGTDLGGGVRKIRMRIASKGKGKGGGARIITFTVIAAWMRRKSTFSTSTTRRSASTLRQRK